MSEMTIPDLLYLAKLPSRGTPLGRCAELPQHGYDYPVEFVDLEQAGFAESAERRDSDLLIEGYSASQSGAGGTLLKTLRRLERGESKSYKMPGGIADGLSDDGFAYLRSLPGPNTPLLSRPPHARGPGPWAEAFNASLLDGRDEYNPETGTYDLVRYCRNQTAQNFLDTIDWFLGATQEERQIATAIPEADE